MNPYVELKTKHQKEIDNIPLGFAFNEQQFNEMMSNWGLDIQDTDKIYSLGGGGYVRKCDSDALHEMFDRHTREREEAIKENKDDYLYHMFIYELVNRECSYTGEIEDALDALDLTIKEIGKNEAMLDAFRRALTDMQIAYWMQEIAEILRS